MSLSRTILIIIGVVCLGLIILPHGAAADSNNVIDVSWPNCHLKYEPRFYQGIIGVNGGLDFRPNPCLSRQTTWFSRYELYLNTGYPGGKKGERFRTSPRQCAAGDEACLAYNYGFHAALYSINYANLSNAHAIMWWLDVETENSWNADSRVNRMSLLGMMAAIKQKVPFVRVGFYSYPGQWNAITNHWHNGLPAWVATGSTKRPVAKEACRGKGFTGVHPTLAQYTVKLDQNIVCDPASILAFTTK